MPRIRTHYDNLKVARDAPIEVIRAAYKSLSFKYHPDLHPGSDNSRITRIINASYEVLSDSGRRREHDRWIADAESNESASPVVPEPPHKKPLTPEPISLRSAKKEGVVGIGSYWWQESS
jgi:curved DNA-binding protein CbpA